MDSRTKSSEPPETDLDYYSRPENYTGSNLSTLTKFLAAKEKEEAKSRKKSKKKKNRSEERNLFRRYKHILPADSQDDFSSSSSSSPSSSSDESDENETNKNSVLKASNSNHRLRRQKFRKDKHRLNEQKVVGQAREDKLSQDTVRFSEVAEEKAERVESLSESGYESRVRSENEEQFQETKEHDYDSEHEDSPDFRNAPGPVRTATSSSITATTTGSVATIDIITSSSSSSTSSQSTSRNSLTTFGQTAQVKKPGLAKFISVRNRLTGLTKEVKRRVVSWERLWEKQLVHFHHLEVGFILSLIFISSVIPFQDPCLPYR